MQLLVFDIGKHGYAELSEFLGVEKPSKAYPRSNDTAAFQGIVFGMKFTAVALCLLQSALLAFVLRAVLRSGFGKGLKTD